MSPCIMHGCYAISKLKYPKEKAKLANSENKHSKAGEFSLLFMILSSRQKFFRLIYN